MKKVLIITHWGGIAGGNVSLMQMARAIESMPNDYSLTVYCPNTPPEMFNWLHENKINVVTNNKLPATFNHYRGSDLPIFTFKSLRNIYQVLRRKGWTELSRIIDTVSPDIVILNSMTLCWMGPLIRKMGIKVICYNRETYAKGLFGIRTKFIKSTLMKNFDGVAFISNYDQEKTGKIRGISRVITDKVDIEVYNEIRGMTEEKKDINNNQPFRIAYLGGMSKLKGAHVIIKALASIKNEEIKLMFFKYGVKNKNTKYKQTLTRKIKRLFRLDYEEYVLKLINKNNLWDKVEFYPTVKNPENYILKSNLLVFPSTEPHQARPLYEAGAARVPIIITEFEQTKEFANNGINCLTFSRNRYSELATLILNVKNNRLKSNELIENNYLQTREKHNIKNLAKELDELIKRVL